RRPDHDDRAARRGIDERAAGAPPRRARGRGPQRSRRRRHATDGVAARRRVRPWHARLMPGPLILAVESSCDETGIALVSGGQTFLVEMTDHLTYRLLGQTIDDAAGEAFDKVGRLLGLGYPGGPAIMKSAADATSRDTVFPRAWLGDTYDFSFSGLKTAA